jgi:hypothetical protein
VLDQVPAPVLAGVQKHEVSRVIVESVTVLVMDVLAAGQRPAQEALHDQAVEIAAAAGDPELNVALGVEAAATPRAVAAARWRWRRAVAEIRFEGRAESGGDGWPRRP